MRFFRAFALIFLFLSLPVLAAQNVPEWVKRSNENSKVLNAIFARYNPEGAATIGIDGHDDQVLQLWPDRTPAAVADFKAAIATFEKRLATEKDPAVRQDLEILIGTTKDAIEGVELNQKYLLPYQDLAQTIFRGYNGLLDDQVPAARRPAALVRLRRYTGLEKGYTPITEQATALLRDRLKNGKLAGPFKDNLEQDIANSERFLDGVGQLFQTYSPEGYAEPLALLKKQFAAYNDFLRKEVMPRAAADFRLPEPLYRYNLRTVGVDMPVEELVSRAKVSFREIQNEMQSVSAQIATQRNLPSSDYRDVIRELKKQQVVGDAVLPLYQHRLGEIEKKVRDTKVVSLPQREARIRLASEAESAAIPAPHLNPPRLLGNTGESAEFVLPLRIPSKDGKGEVSFDDFSYDAASWTLTVHEARPGHELQFAYVLEKGVSDTRALYALNSTNVEGWALYMEAEMKPQMPLDGQLVSLQHRLMRAARAILDPSLQLGWVTRDDAYRMLQHDVVLSPAMAQQEVERYTFRAPGQATSYYCGYTRLMEMRTDAERILGDRFDRQAYHDFVLSQGLLPMSLLRKAVLEDFVKQGAPAGSTLATAAR